MTTKTDEQERAEFMSWLTKHYYYDDLNKSEIKLAKDAWDAGRAALQSQDREDAERLDWLLRHLPGDAIRYCVGVIADTADIDEFRAAIDHARRIEGEAL